MAEDVLKRMALRYPRVAAVTTWDVKIGRCVRGDQKLDVSNWKNYRRHIDSCRWCQEEEAFRIKYETACLEESSLPARKNGIKSMFAKSISQSSASKNALHPAASSGAIVLVFFECAAWILE